MAVAMAVAQHEARGFDMCEICGQQPSEAHRAKEMMFGSGDTFDYSECLSCGRLRLLDPPDNLSSYYPDGYYSFARRGFRGILKTITFRITPLRTAVQAIHPDFSLRIIRLLNLKSSMRILDVGGGDGNLVKDLRNAGFSRALCVDRFAPKETTYCRRTTLSEVAERWDAIMFHHSFEHIQDQVETLKAVRSKLSPDGTCLLRVPVASWAWKYYRTHWVQLDAPRHMCIHTPRSLELVAKAAGLRIVETVYDSGALQFWGSELYRAGVSLVEGHKDLVKRFGKKQLQSFAAQATELNQQGEGDQAAFILRL